MSLINYTSGLSLADELKLLNQAVQDQQTSRYLDVAAVVVMLYDILITIDQSSLVTQHLSETRELIHRRQVSLIWKARWSQGKILYFVTRYPVAIEGIFWLVYSVDLHASEPFCKFEAYLGIWGTLVFLIPLQIVIILRTIAIWDRRRTIIILLGLSLFATDTVILVTLSRVMREFTFSIDQLLRPILGCNSGLLTLSPTTTIPAWAGVIAFDTVLFVLTLAKALRSYKIAHTRLLTVLIRDGFAYYCIMFALGLSNLLLLSTLPLSRSGLAAALTPVLRASYSIIGSRIVLNLRGAASAHLSLGAAQQGVRLVELSGSSNSGSEPEPGSGVGLTRGGISSLERVPNAEAEAGEWKLGVGSRWGEHSSLGFGPTSTALGSAWGEETTLHD